MVSKKYIKELDFENIQEFFNYIVLSEINGNRTQVHKLINKLSKEQGKDFLNYLNEYESGTDAEIVKNILITSI